MAAFTCVCSNAKCTEGFTLEIDTEMPEGLVVNVPNDDSKARVGQVCSKCGANFKLSPGQFRVLPEYNGNTVFAPRIGAPIPELGLDTIAVGQAIPSQQEVHKNIICGNCGTEYPGIMLSFNEHTRSFMGGASIAGKCPICGQENAQDLGSITIDERGLTQIFSSPEFTPTVLKQLKTLVEETQAEPAKVAEFVAKADAIVPSFSRKFKAHLKTPEGLIAFLAMILPTIISLLALFSSSDKPTTVNNYYYPQPIESQSPAKARELPTKRGSNFTPPKKKRAAKHKRPRK